MTQGLFDDARTMVSKANGKLSPAKKSVAMNCIRDLEHEQTNVSAMLPMILELYLQPDPATLIKDQVERCKMSQAEAAETAAQAASVAADVAKDAAKAEKLTVKDAFIRSIERCPIAAAIVAAAWLMREIIPVLVGG